MAKKSHQKADTSATEQSKTPTSSLKAASQHKKNLPQAPAPHPAPPKKPLNNHHKSPTSHSNLRKESNTPCQQPRKPPTYTTFKEDPPAKPHSHTYSPHHSHQTS